MTGKPLLILSGTHGDEYQVISSLKKYLKIHKREIPDFFYIPEISPSAVKLQTRLNNNHSDLNRVFFPDSKDPEVLKTRSVLDGKKFDVCLSFHEDPGLDAFYMYDHGLFSIKQLAEFRAEMNSHHIKLFTGIDDPDDPELGCSIQEGYYSYTASIKGSVGGYLEDRGIVNRFITIEIPGKISPAQNYKITSVVFKVLLKLI